MTQTGARPSGTSPPSPSWAQIGPAFAHPRTGQPGASEPGKLCWGHRTKLFGRDQTVACIGVDGTCKSNLRVRAAVILHRVNLCLTSLFLLHSGSANVRAGETNGSANLLQQHLEGPPWIRKIVFRWPRNWTHYFVQGKNVSGRLSGWARFEAALQPGGR